MNRTIQIRMASRPSVTLGPEQCIVKYDIVISGGEPEERLRIYEYLRNSPWSAPFAELRHQSWFRQTTNLLREVGTFLEEKLPHIMRPASEENPRIMQMRMNISALLGELDLLMGEEGRPLSASFFTTTGRLSSSQPNIVNYPLPDEDE